MKQELILKKWKEFNWIFWILFSGLLIFAFSQNEYLSFFVIGGVAIPFVLMKYAYDFTEKQSSQFIALIIGIIFMPLGYLLVWNYKNKALKEKN